MGKFDATDGHVSPAVPSVRLAEMARLTDWMGLAVDKYGVCRVLQALASVCRDRRDRGAPVGLRTREPT